MQFRLPDAGIPVIDEWLRAVISMDSPFFEDQVTKIIAQMHCTDTDESPEQSVDIQWRLLAILINAVAVATV